MRWLKLLVVAMLFTGACGGAGDNGTGETTTTTTAAATKTTSRDESPTPSATTSPRDTPGGGQAAACSAGSMSEDQPEPPNLPASVAMMRKEILKAAVNCDYELLQQLAMRPSNSFQYSTTEESAGPEAQPARYWREREAAGERPLAILVEILSGPPEVTGVREPEGPGSGSDVMYYTWPRTRRQDGYRTSITSEGDWIYFIRER
jgi:hypothetical protein